MIDNRTFSIELPAKLPTKENADIIARDIADRCLSGELDTLGTIAQLKAIGDAVNITIDSLKDHALDEIRKHGKNGAIALSAKLQEMEGGIKYDYSGCPKWVELDKTCKTADADRKDREKFLKGLSKPMMELDESTGEMIQVLPPVKSSTTTIKVTLADK